MRACPDAGAPLARASVTHRQALVPSPLLERAAQGLGVVLGGLPQRRRRLRGAEAVLCGLDAELQHRPRINAEGASPVEVHPRAVRGVEVAQDKDVGGVACDL